MSSTDTLIEEIDDLKDRIQELEGELDRKTDTLTVVIENRDAVTEELEALKDTVADVITTLGGRTY